jgi:hypothetical protein
MEGRMVALHKEIIHSSLKSRRGIQWLFKTDYNLQSTR